MAAILDREGFRRALFVDDQVSALADNRDPRIDCRLAAWGYVRPEWLVPARLRAAGVGALEDSAVEALRRRPAGRSADRRGWRVRRPRSL